MILWFYDFAHRTKQARWCWGDGWTWVILEVFSHLDDSRILWFQDDTRLPRQTALTLTLTAKLVREDPGIQDRSAEGRTSWAGPPVQHEINPPGLGAGATDLLPGYETNRRFGAQARHTLIRSVAPPWSFAAPWADAKRRALFIFRNIKA